MTARRALLIVLASLATSSCTSERPSRPHSDTSLPPIAFGHPGSTTTSGAIVPDARPDGGR